MLYFRALLLYLFGLIIRVYQRKGDKKMTVNEICKMLNIKGLITCSESDKFISVSHNGMTWLYNKATGTLRAL